MRKLIIIISFTIFCIQAYTQPSTNLSGKVSRTESMKKNYEQRETLITILNPDYSLYRFLSTQKIEIVFQHSDNKPDILVNDFYLKHLSRLGYLYDVVSTRESRIRDMAGYRDYDDTIAELQQIAADHPNISELTSLGNSTAYEYYLEGNENYADFQHQIWCMKISDNPLVEEDEPNVFFGSAIHARETISLEVNMHILNYLVSSYGIVDSVTAWIDNNQIWFIPIINPDGHKVVTEGHYTMHRKSLRDNNENLMPDFSNIDGVDLNRNFGYVWGFNGASGNPSASIYHGPNAWSEPETQYMQTLLTSHKFYAGITYHSYGEWVLYPLGHLSGACSYDHEVMDELAVEMAETIPKLSGSGTYTPMQAVDFGYTCQGTMGDWGYAEERIFSYTFELATSFAPAASHVDGICEDNLQAALLMIDRISKSTVTGNITDESDNPVIAEVHITEIDEQTGMTEVEPVRSGSTFGRYYRLLLPGSYTFTFSYPGYEDVTVENVLVTSNAVTELNIQFTEVVSYDDSVRIDTADGFVSLTWTHDPLASYYEIHSSSASEGPFELDVNGEVFTDGSWREPLTEQEKFYQVVKFTQE